MNKRPSWYDPETERSPLLTAMAELRLERNRAEHVMPHANVPGSLMLIEAIKSAIDDWTELEKGARDYFYGRGRSIGPARE